MPDATAQVLDKIRAILRKADASSNQHEGERDTAMRMANRLLLKHGLSMADVGQIEADDTSAGREFADERVLDTDAPDSWRGLLLHRLSRVYFCKVYFLGERGGPQRWFIVGRKSNSDTVRAMYEFIAPQIQRELDTELAAIVRTGSPNLQQQARHARTYAEQAAWLAAPSDERMTIDLTAMSDEDLAAFGSERLASKSGDPAVRDIQALCGIESFHYAKKVRAFIKRGDIARAKIEDMGVWRRSFLEAAVARVAHRVKQLMREEVNDLGEAGMSLVKDENSDLSRFMASIGLNLGAGRMSKRKADPEGMARGDEAGRRADISGHSKVSHVGPRAIGSGS
jgi:hypothetical protein